MHWKLTRPIEGEEQARRVRSLRRHRGILEAVLLRSGDPLFKTNPDIRDDLIKTFCKPKPRAKRADYDSDYPKHTKHNIGRAREFLAMRQYLRDPDGANGDKDKMLAHFEETTGKDWGYLFDLFTKADPATRAAAGAILDSES